VLDFTRIFVDFRAYLEEETKWEQEFRTHANRFRINFNNPHNGPVDQWANDEYKSLDSSYDNTIFMEASQTCFEMKQNISMMIGVEMDDFRMMTVGIKYEEIRDLSQTLYESGLFKNTRLFIEFGKPSNAGAVNLQIYEAEMNHQDDNELFKYSDLLFEVRDLKAAIAKEYSKKLKEDKGEDVEIHRDRIRIRDKGFDRCGKIMRDGKYAKDYGL